MYKVLLCHRRKKWVSHPKLHQHWLDERRPLVLGLRDALGFTRYAQLHQLPRRNFLYQGIRITRSWMVTSLFAAKQGRPIPRISRDRHTPREEQWDVIDQFWYPSRASLVESLTSRTAIGAANQLVKDHRMLVRRTAVIIAEEFVAAADPSPNSPRITTMFCLRSPHGMTRREMLDYWGTSHKRLVLSLHGDLGFRVYNQLHVRIAPEFAPVIEILGGSVGDEFDGVAELSYRGQWDLIRGFLNIRTQIANLRLVSDEISFIDAQRSALVFGREFLFGLDR